MDSYDPSGPFKWQRPEVKFLLQVLNNNQGRINDLLAEYGNKEKTEVARGEAAKLISEEMGGNPFTTKRVRDKLYQLKRPTATSKPSEKDLDELYFQGASKATLPQLDKNKEYCGLLEEIDSEAQERLLDGDLALRNAEADPQTDKSSTILEDEDPQTTIVEVKDAGRPGDGEIFWGMGSEQVEDSMKLILSEMRNLVTSALSRGMNSPEKLQLLNFNDSQKAFTSLRGGHGPAYAKKLRELVDQSDPNVNMIKKLLTGFLVEWLISHVFYSSAPIHSLDSFLWKAMSTRISKTSGPTILQNLYCIALHSLQRDQECSKYIENEANKTANLLALSFTEMFHPINQITNDTSFIINKFRAALIDLQKMKLELAAASRRYEFYTPVIGSSASPRLMVEEKGGSIRTGAGEIRVCVMPAVIAYGFEATASKESTQFSSEVFINASPEERSRGKVICKAIVVMGDK